ncbi:hypothetical protein B5J94_03925 [Moraxella lacunata]|uniref:Amino-acid metabolite efflux pump n=1 Tax=Moraxella lacunata TaxID=477 RepID=A0A1V4H0D2_MORLA|nr:EamA family transporter [Moraxella lacunata]OPH38293.1 hypothetical protein B5J94_03925 [Moraxella lacunata]
MNEMNKKDTLLAGAVIFLWGINFYFIKLVLNEVSPMVLGFLRFVFLLLPAIFIKSLSKLKINPYKYWG